MKSKSVIRASLRATLLTLSISLFVYSCTDQSLDEADPNAEAIPSTDDSRTITSETDLNHPFQKTVGAPIERSIGQRWVNNYINANGQTFEYTISADAIRQILSQPGCNGISLRYGRDDRGRLHIIPVGVDDKGREMKAEQVTTSDGIIDWETSKTFASSYDGTIRSHFFGANTFERLFQNKDCQAIRMTGALDDEEQPQLLLSDVIYSNPQSYEDFSRPCPPFCN